MGAMDGHSHYSIGIEFRNGHFLLFKMPFLLIDRPLQT